MVTTPKGELILLQACLSMDDPFTRERELSALCEACKEFGLKQGYVITEDHEEELSLDGVDVLCIPFWKWAKCDLGAVF